VPGPLLAAVDETAALNSLRLRPVNYDPATAPQDGRPDGHWHVDAVSTVIGRESPGAPVPGGVWETACALVRQYEFSDPRILRAVYRRDDALLGRNMLLEGRFFGLRFYLGVRVTAVIDETRHDGGAALRVWGWSYQTLEGHLEQGRLTYEVIKNLGTGRVSFRVSGYSRRAPIPHPVIRWGFTLFGRRTQLRFYGAVERRLRYLVQAAGGGAPVPVPAARESGLVLAPSGAAPHRLERLARGWLHPASQPPSAPPASPAREA
jgi:uncharacterized protein (UPF0548 family)